MIGPRRTALYHAVQQPGETDAHGTTDPAERETLAQHVFNQCAPLVSHDGSINAGTQLALACFILMMLFTMVGMAIFLYRFAPHAGHASLMTLVSPPR